MGPDRHEPPTYSDLSEILWRERRLMDRLRVALEGQRCLRRARRTRWLDTASLEIRAVREELAQAELVRALEVGALCQAIGIPEAGTLADLAVVAPAPWSGILGSHREALLQATADMYSLADTTPGLRPHPALLDFLR